MRSGWGKVTTEYIGTSLGSGFCASQARRTAGRRLATPPPSPASQAAPGKCWSRSAWYCSASLASGEPPTAPAMLTTAATRARISGWLTIASRTSGVPFE